MKGLRVIVMIWVAGFIPPALAAPQNAIESKAFNPSSRCGECHQEIYAMWRRAMHSRATSDPIFEASYNQAYRYTAGKAKEICLRCHAPVAVQTGDLEMLNPISREGVNCDYCHSVVSVDLQKRDQPIKIALDGVKRGPLRDATSPVHKVARSPLHQSSEFCAGCHEYVNSTGLPILSTYSEWKASPQAKEGKTCQICHMPLTPGETVPASLAPPRGNINLHNVTGGHSIEQVKKAAKVRILQVERKAGNAVEIKVEVANNGSGHSIPTGMPTRRLILDVVLFAGGREVTRFQREYQKKLLDKEGKLIIEDYRTVLDAQTVMEDNRLRPGEKRVEQFEAVILPKGPLGVEATLHYLYEPKVLMPQPMSIDMASDRWP